MQKQWYEIKLGTLVKVEKDTEFPSDMLLLKTSRDNGVAFVDTLNLDGESAMKQKQAIPAIQTLSDENAWGFDGELVCDEPNENLERWEGTITSAQVPDPITVNIK